MSVGGATKQSIFEQTILKNIRRKSVYADQVQIWQGVPLFSWIDINPTELCNRRCVFCPRVDPAVFPNRNLHMDLDVGRKIAGELRRYAYRGGVVFSGFGEPLLHEDIVGLVAVFGRDIHTELVTNGDRLDQCMARELVRAGLDIILVSLYDGPHQRDHFRSVFEGAGLNETQYILRDRWYGEEQDYGIKLTNRAGMMQNGRQPEVNPNKPCYYPHYSLQIDWNGDVLLCVQDWSRKYIHGNVMETSLFEIWRDSRLKEYRKCLGRGERVLEPCMRCNAAGTFHGGHHRDAWANALPDV